LTSGDEELSLNETLEQKYSLYGRLKEMIMYAAALAVSEQGAPFVLLLDLPASVLTDVRAGSMHFATSRLRKYVRSTGKYGKSPFLLGQYGGIGEIVQGFCR
jgi:RAB protein geranylgeranyltransferase component A